MKNADINSTFFKQPIITKISASQSINSEHVHHNKNFHDLSHSCLCDELQSDLVSYRNIDFKTKDLIDMRSLIHQKIE